MSAPNRINPSLDYASPWVDEVIPASSGRSLHATILRRLSRLMQADVRWAADAFDEDTGRVEVQAKGGM